MANELTQEEVNMILQQQMMQQQSGMGMGMPGMPMQDTYFPPAQQQQDSPNEIGVIRELDPFKVLENLRHNLSGDIFDSEKKKWIRIAEPIMNDKGIGKYISIVAAPVSSLITFSNFQLDEIPPLALFVCEKAIPVIHVNYKEYGIKDKANLQILDIQLLYLTIGALKKALGAGDRGVIGRTISENIMNRGAMPMQGMPMMLEQKKGFWSRLNPFSR